MQIYIIKKTKNNTLTYTQACITNAQLESAHQFKITSIFKWLCITMYCKLEQFQLCVVSERIIKTKDLKPRWPFA